MGKITERRKFRKRVPFKPTVLPAQLGDGAGNVDISGMPYHVYARVAGGPAQAVYNDRVPPINNLLVDVGNSIEDPRKFQVLGARSYNPGGVGTNPQTGYAPAIRYEWMAPGGGQDPLHVQLRQIMPLRIGPHSGMTIQLQPGIVYDAASDTLVSVAAQTASMTAHIPATTGKAALVLITVNTSGTLVATKGTEFTLTDKNTPALVLAMRPAVPASTIFVSGCVRVYNTQTAVAEARTNTDVIDLRFSNLNSTIGSVSDTAYGSGWNGDTTHAPSKNAVYDKIETLAPLTAIDDTVYGVGWDGDTTHAPSKNAVYDKINSLAGGGNVSDSGSTTDLHLAVWDGTNSHTIKDGGAVPSGGGGDGWVAGTGTWSYSSVDGATGVISVDNDQTGIIGVGCRVKLTQTTVKYFIVQAVGSYSGGATLITVDGGTDFTLANAAITSPYWSNAKAPLGFNPDPLKWAIEVTDNSQRAQATPTTNTWYNLGSITISIRPGAWRVYYQVVLRTDDSSSAAWTAHATLSTANNSESDADFTTAIRAGSVTTYYTTLYREKYLNLTSKTLYYLNARTPSIGLDNIYFEGTIKTIIRAINAYL